MIEVFNVKIGGQQEVKKCFSGVEKMLSNWNPILKFSDIVLDYNIKFKIELQPVFVPYKNRLGSYSYTDIREILSNPSLVCAFPGHELFDQMNGHIFEYYFERFMIHCVMDFIDIISDPHAVDLAKIDIFKDDNIDWNELFNYVALLTDRLLMFSKAVSPRQNEQFDFLLFQLSDDKGIKWQFSNGIVTQKVNPINITGYKKDFANKEAQAMSLQLGNYETTRRIKMMIKEHLALALYNLRYEVKPVGIR